MSKFMNIFQRKNLLCKKQSALGLDAMLITELVNVRYLSGFTGSNAVLLVLTEKKPRTVLITDERYTMQAKKEVLDVDMILEQNYLSYLAELVASYGQLRIGFESNMMAVNTFSNLEKLTNGLIDWIYTDNIISSLREIKDSNEVNIIRLACEIADASLADLIKHGGISCGLTEIQVCNNLESLLLSHGADGISFPTIVAAGANSAIPHHKPKENVLNMGDFVKIDFGAIVNGYHSDMTRTFILGSASQWQYEIYELVITAQKLGINSLKSGMILNAIDLAPRELVSNIGHRNNFKHSLGHGIGLQVHEAPNINSPSINKLYAGSIVTIEPGIYLPNFGGVRIEDMFFIKEHEIESLTKFPKELITI